MRHIRVLICQVDDETPDLMSDLACCDLATPAVARLQPEPALDVLEATTQEIGTAILRRLLHAQGDEIDAALVAQHRALPLQRVMGFEPTTFCLGSMFKQCAILQRNAPLCWPLASSIMRQTAPHDSQACLAPTTSMILKCARVASDVRSPHAPFPDILSTRETLRLLT